MLTSRVAGRCYKTFSSTSSRLSTPIALTKPIYTVRPITCSTKLYKEDKRQPNVASRALELSDDSHEGAFGRTDNTIVIEHPDEAEHPPSKPVQGRGGLHFKRTLASFTLEGRSVIVTGGARGLGLVMSQACVISGADVAIVDLNSKQDMVYLGILLIVCRGRGTTSSERIDEALSGGESWSRKVWLGFPLGVLTNAMIVSPRSPRISAMFLIMSLSNLRLPKLSRTTARSTTWSHLPVSPRTSTLSHTHQIGSGSSGV